MKKITTTVILFSFIVSGCSQTTGDPNNSSAAGHMATGAVVGGILGGVVGSRLGIGSLGGVLAGAAIGGAMGAIIHNLTVEEQNKRTAALQSAAKKGQAKWTSAGQSPKQAYYQRQGEIENNAGQQVFQSAINQAQFYVDLSTWTGNGLYFVHLIDAQGNTVTVRKIILQ